MRIDNESVEILSSSNIWSSYVSFLIFPKLLYCIDYESLATLKSFSTECHIIHASRAAKRWDFTLSTLH